MAYIKTTTLKQIDENIIHDFINLYNSIFPLKIESEYVSLTYLVNNYIVLCNRLAKADISSKIATIDSAPLNQELDSIDQDLDEMIPSISEISSHLSKDSSPEDSTKLYNLVSRFSILARRKETVQKLLSNNYQDYYTQENDIALIRAELADVVLAIKEQLKSIAQLDINGVKRIDCLEVKPYHLDIVDSWSILPDDKKALKDRLKRYLRFRVVLFKHIEAYAYELVPAYGQRKVYDGRYNDVIPAIFSIAGIDITKEPINPYFSTNYVDEVGLYNFIIEYYTTGECNKELGRKLMSFHLSTESKSAVNDILNHVEITESLSSYHRI